MNDIERPSIAHRQSWLTRNLMVLCVVSFLQDSASELLYPVLPIYLTTTLGAPIAVVGAIEGTAEAIAAMTKMWAGRVADRWRRRPLIAIGYGLAAVGKAVIAAATAWPAVLAGRGVDRLGKGIRGAPRDALLVDGVEPRHRGKAFGLHRAMDTAGAVVGPLLGLGLYRAFDERIRPILLIAVVPAAASVAAVAFVRDAHVPLTRPRRRSRAATLPEPLPRTFRRLVMVLGAFALVNTPDSLLLLRAKAIGMSVTGVIALYVVYNASYALLSYPLGALSDRISPRRIMTAGLLCFSACYIGLGLTDSTTVLWVLFLVYGGFTASTDGVAKAWVSKLVPRERQATAQGIWQGVASGGMLVAGVWAGLAWHGSGRVPLTIAGCTAALVALVLAVVPLSDGPLSDVPQGDVHPDGDGQSSA